MRSDAPPSPEGTGPIGRRHEANLYAELKRAIKKDGLMERQPAYYAGKTALTLGLLAVGVALLFVSGSLWFQMLNAVYMAFVFGQISLLAHDFGHRQPGALSARTNDFVTLLLGNGLLGMSREWWVEKHNRHHGHPNQMDTDPDIDIPLLAFEEDQAFEKRGVARFVTKHQAVLIFPLAFLQAISMFRSSVGFITSGEAKRPVAEALAIVTHFVLYFGLLFSVLEPLTAVLFVVVHRGLWGVYLVSVFAPNHKAMPILESDSEVGFLHRQVLTSRNVFAHPITDFWYGGLNYQIEHHLFPRMPRNKLKKAQPIIKDFCRKYEIPFHETSVLQSYREILHHLHEVGAPLRKTKQANL
jgi:fatty acid desaturase